MPIVPRWVKGCSQADSRSAGQGLYPGLWDLSPPSHKLGHMQLQLLQHCKTAKGFSLPGGTLQVERQLGPQPGPRAEGDVVKPGKAPPRTLNFISFSHLEGEGSYRTKGEKSLRRGKRWGLFL